MRNIGQSARNILARGVGPLIRYLGAPAARLLTNVARWSTRRRGVVVLYHGIGEPQGDWRHELVPLLSARLFELQLRHLRNSYRVVPASQILDATVQRRRGERFPVAITFDDDLESHVRIAAPLLSRLALPATYFITGASFDRPFTFWWQNLQRASDSGLAIEELVQPLAAEPAAGSGRGRIHAIAETIETMPTDERAAVADRLERWVGSGDPPGLSRGEVTSLIGAGCEIGFHTLEHNRLPDLDETALAAALHDGRDQVADAAGRCVDLIAYPHGATDCRVAQAAASAGYRLGFTADPRAVTPATDRLSIGRIGASYASTGHFALKVALPLLRSGT